MIYCRIYFQLHFTCQYYDDIILGIYHKKYIYVYAKYIILPRKRNIYFVSEYILPKNDNIINVNNSQAYLYNNNYIHTHDLNDAFLFTLYTYLTYGQKHIIYLHICYRNSYKHSVVT